MNKISRLQEKARLSEVTNFVKEYKVGKALENKLRRRMRSKRIDSTLS
jgi:hypothetical protein